MRKLALVLLITLSSCSTSQDEEICNCRENTYQRFWDRDTLINQRDISGCYTLEEAKVKQWTTSENYTIIQCDDYL